MISHIKPGAKWKVIMLPELAYGKQGTGRDIGPNVILTFEIECLRSLDK
ncbi:MAG: FKBP-type peptidyl-prolyl cis-trans isomerase [Candidatus Thiodiazotropha sp.]